MPVVLVTGASSGIGTAIVRRMSAAGWEVHAMARRAERLGVLAEETGCAVHAVDVRDDAAIEALVPGIGADALVNNAGLGAGIDGLVAAPAEAVAETIGTNVTAVLQLTRLALPAMIAKGGGHILNMGSVAGLYPINSAVYGASKGAVHLMSMNLRIELRGTGVRVTQINPGRVATEFYDAAVPDAGRRAALKETGIDELRPEDIAEAVHYALTAPSHVNVSLIELQPLEQSFGGVSFDRVTPR
ncbi:MAG: SDR family oxidoreductase [Pseudomonadota bacterium]